MISKFVRIGCIVLVTAALSACGSSGSSTSSSTMTLAPINGATDQETSVTVKGTFNAAITTPTDWTANFILKKQDDDTNLCTATSGENTGYSLDDTTDSNAPVITCIHNSLERATTYTATMTSVTNSSGTAIADATAEFTISSEGVVTTNNEAMANIPDTDPTTVDYALAGASASISRSTKNISRGAKTAEDSGIFVKLVNTEGDGLGTFTINQCSNDSQIGYGEYTFANDVYTGSVFYRNGDESVDIISEMKNSPITATDYSSTIKVRDNGTATMRITADGSTQVNTVQGASEADDESVARISCAWKPSLGCAYYNANSHTGTVAYAISVNASTEAKTYSASSDTTMCDSILDVINVEDNAAVPVTWDCDISDVRTVDLSGVSNLDGQGGAHCTAISSGMTDSWNDAPTDPMDCSIHDQGTAAWVGCMCDALYSVGVHATRTAEGIFTCKVKGSFNQTDAEISFERGSTIYLDLGN